MTRTLFPDLDQPQQSAPIARHSDPVTSHIAAAETEKVLGNLKSRCLENQKQHSEPRTAREIAVACASVFGGFESSYRARPSELVNEGVFAECGFRKCSVTGRLAQTFSVKGSK